MSLADDHHSITIVDAENTSRDNSNSNGNGNGNGNSNDPEDPPGARLEEAATSSAIADDDHESYPNATIQFRRPINDTGDTALNSEDVYGNDNDNDSALIDHLDEDLDLLLDFLIHTEDYVRYPQSKLTILLRARVVTDEDREELQYFRAIVE